MAYVLKSNVTVSDPTNRLPYLTNFGVCGRDLALYIKAQESAGYSISQPHFNAFNAYINGLIADGTWGNVKEVYPLYGKNLAQVSLKLKGVLAPVSLTAINGLSISNFETDGSGLVLGTNNRTFADLNSPVFNTGMTVGDLTDTWGAHLYIDASAIPYISGAEARSLFGSYIGTPAGAKTAATLRQLGSAAAPVMQMFNGGSATVSAAVPTPVKGLAHFNAAGSTQKLRFNNALLETGAATYNSSIVKTNPVWFMGHYPLNGSSSNPVAGFNGKMRFAVITDGKVPDDMQTAFYSRTTALIAALGKAF